MDYSEGVEDPPPAALNPTGLLGETAGANVSWIKVCLLAVNAMS
jgi:hypothetical protein